jgi:glutamate 5-kinase
MQSLSGFRRLVVKVGSSLLIDERGQLNRDWLLSLGADIATLVENNHQVLIVSSGAIGIGCSALGINKSRARLDDLQAAAAVGQIQLVHTYQAVLGGHGLAAAQILMTPDDTENRRRFLNARRTFAKLLERSVIPIINENDTVATEEIRYGDNDRLAARIAQLVMADALILLSDVDGLYTGDPRTDETAEHIPCVDSIDDAVHAMAGTTQTGHGTGGMKTKVQAAQIATHAGCSTIIASGKVANPLRSLGDGGRCTIFRPSGTPATARKQWLAGVFDVTGEFHLDDGAVSALRNGASLLPVGVVSVNGDFNRGDVVALKNASGTEVGRGLTEYSSTEAVQIAGCQSGEIEARLGYRARSIVVHRDELVLFEHE